MNKVILIGRVVNQPELRYTPQGNPLAKFAIAVDRRVAKGQEKEADFFNIVAWQKLAEICNEYLTKGKLIYIMGRLQTRSYETQDGQKRKDFEGVAEEMQMLSGREDGARGGGGGRSSEAPQRSTAAEPQPQPVPAGNWDNGGGGSSGGGFGPEDIGMDDVPF